MAGNTGAYKAGQLRSYMTWNSENIRETVLFEGYTAQKLFVEIFKRNLALRPHKNARPNMSPSLYITFI